MIHEEHLTMTCATQRINNNIYHSRLKPPRPGDVSDGGLLDESKGHLREVHDKHGIRRRHGKRSVSEKSAPVMTESR